MHWEHYFGAAAVEYGHGRPSYPAEAVAWMIGEPPGTVLDRGAGTGKLTATVCALGHDVVAVDPDDAIVDMVRSRSYDIAGDAGDRSRIDKGVSALLSSLPQTRRGGSIELPYVTHAFRATRS